MIAGLLHWAIHSRLVVILLTCVLALVGGYAFVHVNVEAYPDPAPAIIEVVAQYPGASAEEVERQVTVPLEIALAGMPGLQYTRSKSMFGLSHLRNQFVYGIEFADARQEVLNRLATVSLPVGVQPQISPASPIGEIFRYTLKNPLDKFGNPIYSLNDLKTLQDWTVARAIQRIPGIAGVVGCGGTVKRYEIHPDPNRMRQYNITLEQLESAIRESNANVGGSYIIQGNNVEVIRAIGLLGGGDDPMEKAFTMSSPAEAAEYLRTEEDRRLREIRNIIITAVRNVPIRVGMVVEGGSVDIDAAPGKVGVVVSSQIRQGRVGISRRVRIDGSSVNAGDATDEAAEADDEKSLEHFRVEDENDVVQGIVLLRKGEKSLPVLELVKNQIAELNQPGKLLPGVQLEPYYDRTSLIGVTTETVHENLLVGMVLVTTILLVFLGNVRAAIIVAINIPLALMFAFGALMLRGKSANLLSIGAIDFGIIVDSTVIMVEHIYRRLSQPSSLSSEVKQSEDEENTDETQKRVLSAAQEVQRSLFFSTLIMVCALLPLFTLRGPEGQIFGPMADTYAFALGGALLLAVTISPVLCTLLFRRLKPVRDNFVVRFVQWCFVGQLKWMLKHRVLAASGMLAVLFATLAALPMLGREFMPELEEGNLVIRGTFPANIGLDEVALNAQRLRGIIMEFPEVQLVASQVGRPDDGTDPTGINELQCFVPLRKMEEWPIVPKFGRPRTKNELVEAMSSRVESIVRGASWDFSQIIRDNVMESLSGVKGENSIKVFGPDLVELENIAHTVQEKISRVPGVVDAGIFRIQGQTNLTFPIDRQKCAVWGVRVADIDDVVATAVGGNAFSEMIEGEKRFDISLRWPEHLRDTVDDILNIMVDVVHDESGAAESHTATGQPDASGAGIPQPSVTGTILNDMTDLLQRTRRRRLGDMVTPHDKDGNPDPNGSFASSGASIINREQGRRLIAIKFAVRERDLASTVAEAQRAVEPLIEKPYSTIWSGEFQQMQEAEHRMLGTVLVAFALILVMLYLAFFSLRDAMVVYTNVLAMSLGGVWALLFTGLNFNISAAVGFISILGVAVMNGLLMVSSFNDLRRAGHDVHTAIIHGIEHLVCPITMTALAAILGLLPAALATKVGSQSQRPLAIVVVGGMLMTLLLFNLVPLLYSFYGHRKPPKVASTGH
ncbi:MAG TPA: efflux RND transporter permease subunit [Planctomycetaceae bacterium]|nr:efflux RND transporter permease subunit [Planctomycetaceae bacterium]